MHASAIPSIYDLGGLFAYVFGNPFLFISSTTVMTSALVVGAALASALPRRDAILRRAAPPLAIVLVYFGLGSFALSLQILLRFPGEIPYETEVQFVSGLGHLVVAAAGLAVLRPHLRGHAADRWRWAHTAALGYWTFQIAVLTPPWFAFQGQRELVTLAALVLLLVAAIANVVVWRRSAH